MSIKAVCKLTALAVFVMIGATGVQAGKEKFERCKPHCNVGTIGHVDHSKTLVRSQAQIKGFGTFTIRDRKARTNASQTYPMRIMTQQRRDLYGKTIANDRRIRMETTRRNKKTKVPAAANFPDMTPEEYREKWNLPTN